MTTPKSKSDSYKPKCQYNNINTMPYEGTLGGAEGL